MTNRTGYFGTTRLRYSVVLAASVAFVAGCATATPTGQVAAVMGPARPVTAVPATRVPAGTTVPGAANCPMFPADNVWNTNISKLPVDKHSAAWLRQHALLDHVPAPGLRAQPRRLSVRHPVHGRDQQDPAGADQVPVRERELPRPVSVRPGDADRGWQERRRRPARDHGEQDHLHALRALGGAVLAARVDGRLGRDVAPHLQRTAARRLDVGGRRGAADPAGPARLRAGRGSGAHRQADHARDPLHRRGHPVRPICGRPATRPDPA